MRQQILTRGLWFLGLALAGGCGGGGGDTGGSGNPGGSGSGNPGGSSSGSTSGGAGVSDDGGASSMCMWEGSGWVCPGQGAPPPAGGSDGAAPGQSDAGAGTDGTTTSADSGGAMSGVGPAITFTEFPIDTPSQPGQIVAGKDGNLWFIHQSTKPSALSKMTLSGAFSLYTTPLTNIGPVGIAAGPDGNVWYTKQQGVGFVTPGGQINERGVPGGHDSAGITTGPDGNLWFTEPIANNVANTSPGGNFTEYAVPTADGGPYGITTGPDGNLWFTEQNAAGNKIGRVTPTGTFTEWPIPTMASNAWGIAKGPDGNVWFTEKDGLKIGRITPTGTITEFPVPSGGNPGAIVAGPDGNLWFAETGASNAIGRITPAGAIAEYQIPTPNAEAQGICLGPDGNIYFTELSVNNVGRISNLMGGGTVKPGLMAAPPPAMPCTNDTDCIGAGHTCGGDVCSAMTHTCVGSATMDPGTCSMAAQCWCMSEGATCDATTHHCSFTMFGGPAPLPDAGR